MALASTTLQNAVVTPTAFAAPTVSETIASPGIGKYLWVKFGATPCTVTIARPGTWPAGDINTTYSSGALSSTERIIPITGDYRDPTTSLATVGFSSVATTTALLITVSQ